MLNILLFQSRCSKHAMICHSTQLFNKLDPVSGDPGSGDWARNYWSGSRSLSLCSLGERPVHLAPCDIPYICGCVTSLPQTCLPSM